MLVNPESRISRRAPPPGQSEAEDGNFRPIGKSLSALGLKMSQSVHGLFRLDGRSGKAAAQAKPAWELLLRAEGIRAPGALSGRGTRGLCVAIWAGPLSPRTRTSSSLFPN